ncbi:hypothetical protein B0H15DRAFT_848291 [Mycena belliarum]|uniref:Uncharacterized protein n=1 Tax=Mycena belliarum TaxID=1033014 RepID=A0AAD6U2F2_9AGAR|nr:hypothetical protein B0H15DRAFT_848291 [Mycena belliae]
MRFLLTAAPLISLFIALTSAEDILQDICDPTFGKRLAAFKDKGCQCQTNTFIKQDGGTACAVGLPTNAKAICVNIDETSSKCGYQCLDGYTDDGKSTCTKTTTPDDSKPAASPTPASTTAVPAATGDLNSPACPDPMIISYSSPTGPCSCTSSRSHAKKRTADAVICEVPANGNLACKNLGKGSKCTVTCNDGFKPSVDEISCIGIARNESKSEFDCGPNAGNVGFLSADPVKGCVCEPEKKSTFCGVTVGDDAAEMMCSDSTDGSGKREVKCAVKCSDGFTAKDQYTCERVEEEGDTVTMAGTSKPRDSEEVSCAEKLFKLSGKGGCKCATTVPAGATECPAGKSPNNTEYAICQYFKGSGEEASCTTECIKGTYKRGDVCR